MTRKLKMALPNLFEPQTWNATLETYGSVTNLTIQVYDLAGRLALGPVYRTVLFDLFAQYGFDPALFEVCSRRCLAADHLGTPLVNDSLGLAVVGIPLRLDGQVVGAAVAGYVLNEFAEPAQIRRLARTAGVPFDRLWAIVRTQPPMPQRRLLRQSELLRVLGNAMLRESARTRTQERRTADAQAQSTARDEFLAVLSHELRTPLTSILGWTQILKRPESDPSQLRHGLDVIERNAMLQARLVEDILDINYFRRGNVVLDIAVLDLNQAVRQSADPFGEVAARKKISLEIDGTEEPVWIRGDAVRLQQVLRNLLSNALKFTPAGGRVRAAVTREAGFATITVSDTGEGIAPEFLPRVFDLFNQAEGRDRAQPGLGIGLALVKQIIEHHAGEVVLTSRGAGQGTEASVRLPLARPDDVTPVEASDAPSPPAPLDGINVLIVDDVQDAREMLRLLLEAHGAHVSMAGDGAEALAKIVANCPDLVLCDVRMPGMNGFQFISRLRKAPLRCQPAVVAVSAAASGADQRRTHEAGFDAHVNKPFAEKTVMTAIAAARRVRRPA
jgi:signal transduction histidine kinase